MSDTIGILGVGHLAGYLVEGLHSCRADVKIILSPRNMNQAARLVEKYGAIQAESNQAVVQKADLLLLTTRPGDALSALAEVSMHPEQVVVSAVAGIELASLAAVAAPASVVRVMPLSCAAICQSPTVLYPDHPRVRQLFEWLGTVHVVESEQAFNRASVIAAFYGWIYALLEETAGWVREGGLPDDTARSLVLSTVKGAADLAVMRPDHELSELLDTLATPGGITRYGLGVLEDEQGLQAWRKALQAVYQRLTSQE